MKDCLSPNSHLGILQPISSSKSNIPLSRNLMEGFMQHRGSETAKIIPIALHIKDCLALNSHLIILQTSSSFKPYIILSRNLMGGSRHIGYTKKNFIPLRSQRGSNIKQVSWNSSNNIIFQTIYPLEQKLHGRLRATWRLRSS